MAAGSKADRMGGGATGATAGAGGHGEDRVGQKASASDKAAADRPNQPETLTCDDDDESGVKNLYPVAVLIDELRHDSLACRKRAVQGLATIARALGSERTREELLPFLAAEVLDDDDEVLVCLCEQLAGFVRYVGGPAYAHALFCPLEELANTEEAMVRGKVSDVGSALIMSC